MTKLLVYHGGAGGQFLSFIIDPTYEYVEINNEYFGKKHGHDYIYDADQEISISRCTKVCSMHMDEYYRDIDYLGQFKTCAINTKTAPTYEYIIVLGALKSLLNNNINYWRRGEKLMSLIESIKSPISQLKDNIAPADLSLYYEDIFIHQDPTSLHQLIDFFNIDISLEALTAQLKSYTARNIELLKEHNLLGDHYE